MFSHQEPYFINENLFQVKEAGSQLFIGKKIYSEGHSDPLFCHVLTYSIFLFEKKIYFLS